MDTKSLLGFSTKETRARADKTVRQRNDNKRGQCLQRPLMSDVKTPVVAPGVIGKHEKREAEIDIAACGTYGLHIQCSSFANGIGVAAEKRSLSQHRLPRPLTNAFIRLL